VNRNLSPSTNPAGITAAIAALYAAGAAIWHAVAGHAAIDPSVIIAALTAFAAALTRQVVTPVSDPKDGNGQPLVTPAAAGVFSEPEIQARYGLTGGPYRRPAVPLQPPDHSAP
jgi:hypothetical protein